MSLTNLDRKRFESAYYLWDQAKSVSQEQTATVRKEAELRVGSSKQMSGAFRVFQPLADVLHGLAITRAEKQINLEHRYAIFEEAMLGLHNLADDARARQVKHYRLPVGTTSAQLNQYLITKVRLQND